MSFGWRREGVSTPSRPHAAMRSAECENVVALYPQAHFEVGPVDPAFGAANQTTSQET